MIEKEQVVKITWFSSILTSGFISLTMVTTVHLLRSKNSQRSIICGLLKVSRKGFEVLFLFASSSNLLSGHSEGQKWSGQPSTSWYNFSRWPPHSQNLDIAVSISHVVRSGNLGEDGQSFEFSIFSSHFVRQSFQRIWKNIVFEESCKTLSCFWKVLIGKMIVRISRCCTSCPERVLTKNSLGDAEPFYNDGISFGDIFIGRKCDTVVNVF